MIFFTREQMKLKYDLLTQYDKYQIKQKYSYMTDENIEDFIHTIWNGVGSSQFPILPKSYIFAGASLLHDFDFYARGGVREFILANIDFFKKGLHAIEITNKNKIFYTSVLCLYTFGLMIFGIVAFEWGTKCNSYDEVKQVWQDSLNRSKLHPSNLAKWITFRIKV